MQLSLNETWKQCLAMWKWISANRDKLKYQDMNIDEIKDVWLEKHGFMKKDYLKNDCFFCNYNYDGEDGCDNCPGRLVDANFHCCNDEYDCEDESEKFYKKLVQLNRKRLSKMRKKTK